MNKLSQLIHDSKEEFTRLLAEDMGKPVFWGAFEVEFTGNLCKYYADITRKGFEKA
jgi:acyl-CoA reductase-like NAD-dependent aldehyde dehydrogenase